MNKVPNTEGVGLIIANRDGELRHIAAVGNGRFWDELQITARSGPILDALQTDKALICDPFDLRKYPDLQQMRDVLAKQEPSAIVVIPNVWTSGAQLVTVVYLAASLSDAELEVIGGHEPLFAYALGLLEYCGEAEAQAEQMVRMVQTRSWIEQAKGMIMTRRSIGPDDAFAVLVEHSQTSNVKVRDLSTALVGLMTGPDGDIEVSEQAIAAAKVLWEDISTRNGQ
jgi:hypothetical protein